MARLRGRHPGGQLGLLCLLPLLQADAAGEVGARAGAGRAAGAQREAVARGAGLGHGDAES